MRALTAVSLLFLVAVLSTTAHAECAWVLWTTSYRMQGTTAVSEVVSPSDAYSIREECVRVLDGREAREEARRKSDPTVERYYACLPDTIDPRGPKAK